MGVKARIRMFPNLTIFIAVLLVLLVPGESKASLIRTFLKFAAVDRPDLKAIQIPPLQSPNPSVGLGYGGGGGDGNFGGERGDKDEHDQMPSNLTQAELVGSISNERCNVTFAMSCQDLKNMTACLSNEETGTQGSFLIVQNDDETPAKVNLSILPSNSTFMAVELQKHQATKINITSVYGALFSFVLNAGNGDCIIHVGSHAPQEKPVKKIPFDVSSVNPIHGAYIFLLVVLIGGGAWACFNFRKRGRHLDGVPYKELEMGQPETVSTANVETAVGWDEDWDDDWDEEKAVKFPGGKPLRPGKANGNGIASGSSHEDGWGNDWDD